MRFKLKPHKFYAGCYYLYCKAGWWPFWRKAGFVAADEVEGRMASLRQIERYL